jgi:serine/threonine-protein kinase RsbW
MSAAPQNEFAMTLSACPENIALVRHAMAGYVADLGADERTVSDVRLAVTEACSNVVLHAYGAERGVIELRASSFWDGDVLVRVRDHGSGMAPRAARAGLGLGIPVIAAVSEAMDISSARGGGIEIAMRFAPTR